MILIWFVTHAQDIGYDDDKGSADSGLGREANLEGELSAVVVHPATEHERENADHTIRGQDLDIRDRANASAKLENVTMIYIFRTEPYLAKVAPITARVSVLTSMEHCWKMYQMSA